MLSVLNVHNLDDWTRNSPFVPDRGATYTSFERVVKTLNFDTSHTKHVTYV